MIGKRVLLAGAIALFSVEAAAVPFEARPPHLRSDNLLGDQTFVDALSDARLREIVDDIRAGNPDLAKKKLILFLKAVPGNIQAIEILGTLLQNEGKYEQAEKLLRQAANVAPQQVSLRLRLAVALLNQQKFAEAAPHLQFAIEKEPDNVLALTNYGWLLAVMERNEQALQIYERLKDDRFRGKISQTDLFVGLAILYFRLDRHDDAIGLLEPEFARAEKRHANNRVFLNLVEAYLGKNDPKAAERVLTRLEKLLPEDHPGALLAGAKLAAAKQDFDGAVGMLSAGLKSYPDYAADIHLQIAKINLERKYFRRAAENYAKAADAAKPADRPAILSEMADNFGKAGKREEATPVLRRFASTGDSDETLKLLLAENLGQSGKQGEALVLLDQMLTADPGLARAHFLKSVILRNQDRVADARVSMRRSVDLDPGNPAAWNLLADLAHDTDGDAAMVEVMKEGLGHNPTDPHLLLGVGSLSYSQGDLAFAEDVFKRMVARYPNDPIGLSNAALAALDQGKPPKEPRELLERALKQAPRVPAIADTWGWMLHKSGKSKEAIDLLNRVAKAIPKDGGVQYHLGVAYTESGQAGLGRAALRKALALGVPVHYRRDIVKRLSGK